MRLKRARITNYKSIDNSSWVNFGEVTCLVGKNESGKTAFLKALQKLSPVEGVAGKFDPVMDYPRKNYLRNKNEIESATPPVVVEVAFELSQAEIAEIEAAYGSGVVKDSVVTASKNYKNARNWTISLDEGAVVNHILTQSDVAKEQIEPLKSSATVSSLLAALNAMTDRPPSVDKLFQDVTERFKTTVSHQIINSYLCRFVPRFVYFDDYSVMRGTIVINELQERIESGELSDADRTFLALLGIVGADLTDFQDTENYERLKAELEAASIGISDEVFRFWSQNKQLEVEFDISTSATGSIEKRNHLNQVTETIPGEERHTIHVRIKNNRHRVTVPFDERSRGFVWFFSFLAYFSQLEAHGDAQIILLLDEPGLSLHAKAQGDFLRFIDERLAPKHQVIYTTHSPFLIDSTKLERVRTVQDKDNLGTVIENDVLRPDRDTIFPIQAALGYELSQTLFVGPNNLLVEGPSDLIYLAFLSEKVTDRGGEGVDPSWTIVPVGGASKLSTFVSLLGSNQGLNVAVLMDITKKDRQVVDNLIANSLLQLSNLIQVSEFTGADGSDIEDLFEPVFYSDLVKLSYAKELGKKAINPTKLVGTTTRIVKKIELYFQQENIGGNGKFSHYRPASYLLQHQADFAEKIDNATLDRAEALFHRVNSLLPK